MQQLDGLPSIAHTKQPQPQQQQQQQQQGT